MRLFGYTIRFLIREQKKRRRVNGRARGFYRGKKYLYVRVRLPDGRRRDVYLGLVDLVDAGRRGRWTKRPSSELDDGDVARVDNEGGEDSWDDEDDFSE